VHFLVMGWFTHFTRPLRKGIAPGGRNHVRRDLGDTLCGVRMPAWLVGRVVILDPRTGVPAYPDCKRCATLSGRHGLPVAARP